MMYIMAVYIVQSNMLEVLRGRGTVRVVRYRASQIRVEYHSNDGRGVVYRAHLDCGAQHDSLHYTNTRCGCVRAVMGG